MTPEQIREAINGLQELVNRRLPERFYPSERLWRKMLAALIVRISGICSSIARLTEPQHVPDALTLLRSLYDHLVLFAWLAIDPESRVHRWYEETNKQRLKLSNDALENLGVALFDEDLQSAADQEGIPKLVADRAAEADAYWSDRVAGLHTESNAKHHVLSLRGLYTVIFRMGSRTSHGSIESIDYCADVDGRDRLVVHPQTAPDLMWPALAVPLFAIALVIAAERLGWPDAEEARQINEAFVRSE